MIVTFGWVMPFGMRSWARYMNQELTSPSLTTVRRAADGGPAAAARWLMIATFLAKLSACWRDRSTAWTVTSVTAIARITPEIVRRRVMNSSGAGDRGSVAPA